MDLSSFKIFFLKPFPSCFHVNEPRSRTSPLLQRFYKSSRVVLKTGLAVLACFSDLLVFCICVLLLISYIDVLSNERWNDHDKRVNTGSGQCSRWLINFFYISLCSFFFIQQFIYAFISMYSLIYSLYLQCTLVCVFVGDLGVKEKTIWTCVKEKQYVQKLKPHNCTFPQK